MQVNYLPNDEIAIRYKTPTNHRIRIMVVPLAERSISF